MSNSEEELLATQALALLKNNTRYGMKEGRKYTFTIPSPASYPFQWFWDSCFHAIAWTYFDVERAKEEIRALLAWQRENGFIPHVIFWDTTRFRRLWWDSLETKSLLSFVPFTPKPRTSEEMQPPALAQAIERIYTVSGHKDFLNEVLPAANRYYDWLFSARDPDGDNLITIITPFESGLDFSPAYDAAFGLEKISGGIALYFKEHGLSLLYKLRYRWNVAAILEKGPFHVEDALVNSILSLNLTLLSRLNREAGNIEKAQYWNDKARLVREALLAKCYDREREAFFNLTGRNEKRYPLLTLHSIFPIMLPDLPGEIARSLAERHIKNENEFWLPYPIPSTAASEPSFTTKGLTGNLSTNWRGSTWVNANWFIVGGLRKHGYTEIADSIAEKTKQLIIKEGFREYFNPFTGEGGGATNFGWSTLVIDM